jgi:predicted SAM-dependent methyltransferase
METYKMMKLHLGCGKRNFGPDWVHIDMGNYPHLHSHNITKLPFDDRTCDLVYASHVLEYFDIYEGKSVLEEWYRVLKDGGTIRLAVPDFDTISRLYFGKEYPLENFLGPLYGRINPEGTCSLIYHKTVYDFLTLDKLLKEIGFFNIRKYDWRKTEHGQFDDQSQAYLPHMDKENGVLISLNVEGTK